MFRTHFGSTNYSPKNTLNSEEIKKNGGDVAQECIEQKEGEERKSFRKLNKTLWCVY